MAESGGFVPALRFPALNRLYDPLMALTTREGEFRRRLLERAAIRPGQRVLDVGCGSGSLLALAGRLAPEVELHGIDPDDDMLERAERKLRAGDTSADLRRGLAGELPYDDGSFDRVFCSLVFHHLGPEGVRAAAAEIARVLRPGGEFHMADWAPPADLLMEALSWQVRLLDGVETTRESFAGRVPGLLAGAGLTESRKRERLRTAFGTLEITSWTKPSRA
jgi:ubiquinone/menaquinone biosynthesis C-methylase UbiE